MYLTRIPFRQIKCDKCGIIVVGGPKKLRSHKQEYHSY
jgi:hypothetical protein